MTWARVTSVPLAINVDISVFVPPYCTGFVIRLQRVEWECANLIYRPNFLLAVP
jgi:hypothetical protein